LHLSFGRNGFNLGIYADHFVSQIRATSSTTARIYSFNGALGPETHGHGHCNGVAFATPRRLRPDRPLAGLKRSTGAIDFWARLW